MSADGRYRYELRRDLRPGGGPLLEWVMLNPSTATASEDDPTIRRCMGFGRQWGYGSIVVRNLYAYRSATPRLLLTVDNPIGPDNWDYLSRHDATCTVVAWGAHPAGIEWWRKHRLHRGHPLLCLGITANGQPRHPLYVPASQPLEVWHA